MSEQIIQSPIVDEVEQSFLDYGLSVITDRAIPSLEDGLKPVARRILWDMQDNGYTHDKKYVKSAVPVGQTLGRAHPHGDSSVYGALVQLSQPWSMRYPLIDLHGSGGSQDGDEPAAARYTECRLSKIGEAMMYNLKKDCVDWQNTYTDEEQEPVYLPGLFPTLLVNGTTGIAVAVATSLAPHNLNEIVDAIIYTAQNPNCKCEDLLSIVKGPDFPGGGQIINKDELKVAYLTGHGRVKVRGQYKIEKNAIIFTSVPYKISKVDIIQTVDKLCDEKKLDGIVSIHDDSSLKTGVRLVIEFDKNTDPNVLVNKLFKFTALESNFNIMQIVLDNKTPKMLNLLELIKGYLKHQIDVLTRVTKFDLNKLNDRKVILDGFLIALEDIDNVITLIKKSESSTTAKKNLMTQYNLSEVQAKAILDMKLSRLARLERIEIGREKAEIEDKLKKLAQILKNPIPELIEQLLQLKKDFGDKRRTEVTQIETDDGDSLITPEKCVVVLTAAGTIKRIPAQAFKTQKRNGKGVKTQEDISIATIRTNTVDNLMVFTNFGKVYRVSVNDIVVGTNTSRGQDLRMLIQMDPLEKPSTIYSISNETTAKYILFVTKNGIVKKTSLEEYTSTKRKTGISAIKLREGDSITTAFLIDQEPIAIVTHNGCLNYFNSTDISPTGRNAVGVKGINLTKNDYVVAALPHRNKEDSLTIFTEDGYAKRYTGGGLLVGRRGKTGFTISPKPVAAIAYLAETDTVLISGLTNSLCVAASEIPNIKGEKALGSMVIKGTNISAVTKI